MRRRRKGRRAARSCGSRRSPGYGSVTSGHCRERQLIGRERPFVCLRRQLVAGTAHEHRARAAFSCASDGINVGRSIPRQGLLPRSRGRGHARAPSATDLHALLRSIDRQWRPWLDSPVGDRSASKRVPSRHVWAAPEVSLPHPPRLASESRGAEPRCGLPTEASRILAVVCRGKSPKRNARSLRPRTEGPIGVSIRSGAPWWPEQTIGEPACPALARDANAAAGRFGRARPREGEAFLTPGPGADEVVPTDRIRQRTRGLRINPTAADGAQPSTICRRPARKRGSAAKRASISPTTARICFLPWIGSSISVRLWAGLGRPCRAS